MRSCWIISAILAIVPTASPFAQQSHLDTRHQIEQMVVTFSERYNKQDAAAIASMFTKDAARVSSAATAISRQRGPLKVDGHWTEVEVREGGVWKIRLLTVSPKTAPNAVTPGMESNSARPESNSADTGTAAVLINIDKTNQKMTVLLDGVETYDWPVSTGRAGYSTPSGTYTASSMNESWYSKQWDNAATFNFLYERWSRHPWQL